MEIIDANLKFKWVLTPLNTNNIQYIILHHPQAFKASPEDIHSWHLVRENSTWAGAGYNYYIRKDGTKYKLRGSNVGSHCTGYNSISYGICCEGNFHPSEIDPETGKEVQPVDYEMSDAQYNSLIDLLLDFKIWYPDIKIVPHRDLQPNACPGMYFPLDEVLTLQYRNKDMNLEEVLKLFNDMNTVSDWAKESVEKTKELGIFLGDENGNFNPQENINREQLAVIICRLLNLINK